MDRLVAMQTFVRVAETGSFSAVAREQNSTQSSISKQVAALERHLGTRLLTRTTHSLALTEDGARYFEDARRLVAEVGEAEELVRSGERHLRGRLRVAASVGYGLRILMPHVRSFLQSHPSVSIDLNLNDGLIDLVEHGIDVAVRIGHLSGSGLIARRIGSVRRVVVASRGYLDRLSENHKPPKVPEELKDHPCIVYTGTSTRSLWEFKATDGSNVSVRVEGPLQSNSSEVIRAAVLDGLGISYSPTWLFQDAIDNGSVFKLLPDWGTLDLPIHLVSPAQRRHAAKVRAFANHLTSALGNKDADASISVGAAHSM